jgi:CubicO group peptidase (beta-lactamase class C family)
MRRVGSLKVGFERILRTQVVRLIAVGAVGLSFLTVRCLASPPADASSPPAHVLSEWDLQTWLDGFMPFALQRDDVAGAVVVVVKDGQVVLQKGYGYADVAARRPVDPETTLFRPGSVSKLFTWTAVMQQVELGRIDLDQDINAYLDFKIPPFQGRPITIRNLMTHTAGFQDALKDLRWTDPNSVPPLGAFLKRQIPARIFAPGEVPAYSNFGTSLGGYIVERVSGQAFDDYIEQHIFAPLGMRQATFRQPLPAQLRAGMSAGYNLGSEAPKPYELSGLVPAASAAVSGADMAKFMIAHLQDGEYEGQRILRSDTARLMHDTPLTIINSSLNRMLLGFYELNRNGHRIIGHEGDTRLFHSALELFPDDHVGLFLSLNSLGRDSGAYAVRTGLLDGFADRYFPGPSLQGFRAPAPAKNDAAMLVGHYDGSRREETSFAAMLNLVLQVTVTADEMGHIVASPVTGLGGQPRPFEEVAPFVWREIGGQDRLAAKVVDGKVVMWAEDGDSPYLVYTRTPSWRDATWLIPLLGFSMGVLLLTAVAWPISVLVRRRYGASFSLRGRAAQAHRWVRVAGIGAGLLMFAWLATLGVMAATFYVSSALEPWILILHLLSIVVFPIAAVVSLWSTWVTCTVRRDSRRVFAWVWSGALALSCLTLCWVALVFHLIGLSLAF